MSLLAEVVSDILTGQVAGSQNRKLLVGFGILTTLGSIVLLLHFYRMEPITVESFARPLVEITDAIYDEDKQVIKLIAGTESYSIHNWLWQERFDPHYLVKSLREEGSAQIWLESLDSRTIMGVENRKFLINPQYGVNWSTHNNKFGFVLGWMFLGCGVFISTMSLLAGTKILK